MHDIVAHNIAVMIALADDAACTAADSPYQAVTLMGHVADTGRSALTEWLTMPRRFVTSLIRFRAPIGRRPSGVLWRA
jgi:hypothetical protein